MVKIERFKKYSCMVQPTNPLEDYRRLIKQRREIWSEKYSPAVIEALTEEINALVGGLEQILRDSGTLPTEYTNTANDFYRDPKFSGWVLDESKLPELGEEQNAVVRFAAGRTFATKVKVRAGRYHHTTTFSDVKRFLFDYWKENNPTKFSQIVNDTIRQALVVKSYHGKDTFKRHFQKLRLKEPSQVTFEDIQHRGYLRYVGGATPIRLAYKSILDNLIGRDILQITPGYKNNVFSVPMRYLSQ